MDYFEKINPEWQGVVNHATYGHLPHSECVAYIDAIKSFKQYYAEYVVTNYTQDSHPGIKEELNTINAFTNFLTGWKAALITKKSLGSYRLRYRRLYGLPNYENEAFELEREFPGDKNSTEALVSLQKEIDEMREGANLLKVG